MSMENDELMNSPIVQAMANRKYIPVPLYELKPLDMENDKTKKEYYTPNIEDIRVGYETTIRHIDSESDKFKPFIITKDNIGGLGVLNNMDGFITPYLTKEQIEAEGWRIGVGKDYHVTLFRKDKYTAGYNWENKTLKVVTLEKDVHTIFNGECKSINEFRYICKLIGI